MQIKGFQYKFELLIIKKSKKRSRIFKCRFKFIIIERYHQSISRSFLLVIYSLSNLLVDLDPKGS